MGNVKWIKVNVDMFDNVKFRVIDTMPERDSIIYIWVRLLCEAGKIDDEGYIKITNWEKYQNVDGMNKLRKKSPKKSLSNNKNNCNVTEKKCNVTQSTCNVTVTQQNKNKKEEEKEKKRETREKVSVTQNEKSDSEKQAKTFCLEKLNAFAKGEGILSLKNFSALSNCHDTRSILTPREYGEPLPRSYGC
ncbi:MAG: phage replisome organizer N-terminal domain-containing protein [Clostridiaceae bacterium]|nr:phage replisome organizer N-terminal domain-containing protein [Clostridiaceae bacterium]